jgi:3-methyladenine DNA glycosylase AlkD
LPLIEKYSTDERNFVKKAVNWALRQIGKRNAYLNFTAIEISEKLVNSESKTAKWIGKDALIELTTEKVLSRIKDKS